MHLNFFDLLHVELPEGGGIAGFLSTDLAFFEAREAVGRKLTLRIRYDESLVSVDRSGTIRVGEDFVLAGGHPFIADSSGLLCEWPYPFPGADFIEVRVHPRFNPYRVLYYLLLPLLKSVLVREQRTLLHASAAGLQDRAIVLSGWGGTGKTNTLIRFMSAGATYLADDLAIVGADGSVWPFPRPLNVFDYNIRQFPELRGSIPTKRRAYSAAVRATVPLLARALPQYRSQLNSVGKVSSQAYVNPTPLWQLGPPEVKSRAELVILYVGASTQELEARDPLRIADAAIANIRYELNQIEKLSIMHSFATGLPYQPFVSHSDEQIIRSFVNAAELRVLSVAPGHDAYDLLARDVRNGKL